MINKPKTQVINKLKISILNLMAYKYPKHCKFIILSIIQYKYFHLLLSIIFSNYLLNLTLYNSLTSNCTSILSSDTTDIIIINYLLSNFLSIYLVLSNYYIKISTILSPKIIKEVVKISISLSSSYYCLLIKLKKILILLLINKLLLI